MTVAENSGGTGALRGRPFPAGTSGNPGGRPRTRHLTALLEAELARATGADRLTRERRLVERLVTIALSGRRSEALLAMRLIFGYVDGLPAQPVEMSGEMTVQLETARRLLRVAGGSPD